MSAARDGCTYLPESERQFPGADELAGEKRETGFWNVNKERITGGHGCAERARELRRLYLAVHGRGNEAERMDGESTGYHGGVGCDEQGSGSAGVQVCREHDLLCVHAGGGDGQ